MAPSSTADARSAAFHQALSFRLRPNSRPPLVSRSRPKACAEHQKTRPYNTANNPTRSNSRSSPAVSPPPQEKDALVYRPEAVLSMLALGFLSSIAFLAHAGRRIAADVSARAKTISQKKHQAQRYKTRLREKEFLESAIEATTATLSNTEDFLAKQIKRAEQAEVRLRELEVSSADVDAAMQKTNELKIQLKEKEAELEDKRLRTKENTQLLATIQADVYERREVLSSFEEEAQEAQRELNEAQQTASENLKSALTEKQHLEAVLEQKQAQLAEEMDARDNFLRRISEEEVRLQQTEIMVDQTLSDIEARRRKIDIVAKQAEHIGKIASQEKLALETAVVREVRAEDVEESLRQMAEKQRVLRSRIQTSQKSETQQASLCANLKREIEERDKLLQEQRARLNALNREESSRAPRASTNDVREMRDKRATDAGRIAVIGTSPHHTFESAVIDDNLQSTLLRDSTTSAKSKSPIKPSTPTDDDIPVPAKRRRGRPRKTDAGSCREPQNITPKKGRGRRRTEQSSDSVKELLPKKKRGRPRKAPVTAMQENLAQRLGDSSLTQRQDSDN